ncbi:hypothetical protein [Rhodococcus pyridinivorans]|uniref:hypothetical protein n=1 Tax=Rhodococcus pyridinivorans TaxID=103816 RepID=UPI003AB00A8D
MAPPHPPEATPDDDENRRLRLKQKLELLEGAYAEVEQFEDGVLRDLLREDEGLIERFERFLAQNSAPPPESLERELPD